MWRVGGCHSPHVILWMRYEVMLSLKNEVMRYHQWFYQTLDPCMQLFQVLIYLCVDHRYLWFAGCFVKQCAFQSESNIQQSDHASADFDDRTSLCFSDVWPKLMLMNLKQLWQWFFTLKWLLYCCDDLKVGYKTKNYKFLSDSPKYYGLSSWGPVRR